MKKSMEKPKVTIITLTFNCFTRIFNTIESVLNQDYSDIEYIISDDGSKSFPGYEINKFIANAKSNNISIKVIHHETNIGTVKNANQAVKASTGKYIMYLSCGDIFYTNDIVSRIVERFLQTNSNVIVATRVAYINENIPLYSLPYKDSINKILKLNTCQKQYQAFITTHFWNMASGSAMYVKKSILEDLGYYDERYYLWEDGPFLEKYLQTNTLEYAYDIKAIWYEIGGVSTKGKVNPILDNDRIIFDRSQRDACYSTQNRFTKSYINYIKKRSYCESKTQLNLLRISHPIIMLSDLVYKIQNHIYKNKEIKLNKTNKLLSR